MQHGEATSGPVMRLFEARAKRGRADELARKLATVSVEVVRNKPGNEGYFFGQSVAGDDDIFVFASVWKDLSAVKDRFGADWQSSYLPEGYGDLIDECSVRHFDLGSGWHLQAHTRRLISFRTTVPLGSFFTVGSRSERPLLAQAWRQSGPDCAALGTAGRGPGTDLRNLLYCETRTLT